MGDIEIYQTQRERQKPVVELLAQMTNGNFVRLKILDVQLDPTLVRIIVAYEDIADIVRTSQKKFSPKER